MNMESKSLRITRTPIALAIAMAAGMPAMSYADCAAPATYTVDRADDVTAADGETTLREAVALAQANAQCRDAYDGAGGTDYDTIAFDLPAGSVVTLDNSVWTDEDSIHIDGSTAGGIILRTTATAQPMIHAGYEGSFSELKVTGVVFDGENTPRTEGAIYGNVSGTTGGGIELSNVVVQNFDITSEASSVIVNNAYAVEIADSVFMNNHTASGNGGALNIWAGSAESDYHIRRSTFSGNSAYYDGGAIHMGAQWSTLVVDNSTISGNTTDAKGGGISIGNGYLEMNSSTVSGNSATGLNESTPGGYGAGIFSYVSNEITLNHVTVTNNVAANSGGGVGGYESSPVIVGTHTILAGNTATGAPAEGDVGEYTTESLDHSLVGGDPKLWPLAWNGGPTQTHKPMLGSAAIDGGDAAWLGSDLPATDQRGAVRVLGDDIDIGAVEFGASVSDDDSGFLGNVGLAWLAVLALAGLRRRRRS